jgi:homoserine kinase
LVPVALQGLNRIPLERGLGSSAAACVAGITLADRLLELGLDRDEVLDLAIEIEGHADNAAAAIVGGFTLAFGDGVLRLDVAPGLRPVALIPNDVRVPTTEARAALQPVVPREAAVYNLSHAAAAVVALTSRPELLATTLTDRLHQDVRLAFVPTVRKVFDDLQSMGVPVCVSGAGPTLLAFELPDRPVPDPGEGWCMLPLAVAVTGVEVAGS